MTRLHVAMATACLAGAACGGPAERIGPPPIVLLSIDTFRADRVGAYGNPDGLTPNLDAFAEEAIVFENAYSQAVQTAPSHTSLFTSRYPSEQVGPDHSPFVPPDQPRLAELLKIYGYQTAAFVGGADMSVARGHGAGFDTYTVTTEFGSFYHSGPASLAWLDAAERSQPYFLFAHGYDTHSPYLRPTPYGYAHSDARIENQGQIAVRTATERIVDGVAYPSSDALMRSFEKQLRPRSDAGKARTAVIAAEGAAALAAQPQPMTDADLAVIRDVYDGAVSYADTMVGLFLAGLRERGVLDEAVVVILADHGEQLGEHGVFGHCCEANDEETHVPLMIRLPKGEGGGRRVSAFVELVDVMPTLLELAGALPPAHIHGRSLGPALRGEPFAGRDYAVTQGTDLMRTVTLRGPQGRLSYMGLSPTSARLPELVELARLDGPGFVASPGLPEAERAAMRTSLVSALRALSPPPTMTGKRPELPAALRKSLREHGYWEVKE